MLPKAHLTLYSKYLAGGEWSHNHGSVQFSRSVVSDSLRPHELQHARPPCPSPTPGVHSNSRPSNPWFHPAISSSVFPFSSCPQSLPASESFPMSQLFAWGGQGTGVSALASFLPKNTQDWSPLEWTGWISLQPRDSQESPPTPQSWLWVINFLYSFSVYSCHLFLISSASVRSIAFLSLIVPTFAWNVPLGSLIFLKRSLVFPILLFSSISLHCSIRRLSYLSLLFFGTLYVDGYIFPFLLCFLLLFLFSAICKASLDNHFAFLHFFFLEVVFITASCAMSWTSVLSSSGTLSDLIPWIYLWLPLYNCKGFDLGHNWMI